MGGAGSEKKRGINRKRGFEMTKWQIYESEKKKLKGLTAKEYEKANRKLVNKLKI